MPELPEAETIARDLNRKIKGKTIKSVQVKVPKLIKLPNTEFVQALKGQKIGKVSRRAKVIKIELNRVSHNFKTMTNVKSSKLVLLIHLKLTGQLIYREKSGEITAGGHPIAQDFENLPNKHTHTIFTFTDKSSLFYNDLRKFGWMNLLNHSDVNKLLNQEFGVEPLSPKFTLNTLKQILKKKKSQPIKKVLLDQKNIAGIGNIYADEFCFYAGIKPTRQAGTLKSREVRKLWQGIRTILKQAIKHRGTSTDNYVDASGRQGGYAPHLKVYARAGEKCKRPGCKGLIKKIKFGGRGTHYCEKCQK